MAAPAPATTATASAESFLDGRIDIVVKGAREIRANDIGGASSLDFGRCLWWVLSVDLAHAVSLNESREKRHSARCFHLLQHHLATSCDYARRHTCPLRRLYPVTLLPVRAA